MEKALAVLFLSVVAAVIPTSLYVLLVWWLDRYEKEPVLLLAAAFVWGAVPGVVLALMAELVAGVPVGLLGASVAAVVNTSLVAPLVEEAVKATAVLLLFLAFRREFDDVLDGIVYGAMVGFGFALTENVFYFLSAFATGGLVDWGVVVFLRSAVFGLNHALYTSITGAGFGLARYYTGNGQRLVAIGGSLALACTLHTVHNLFAQVNDLVCGAILISLMSDWGGVLVVLLVVLAAWRKEHGWIVQELADEVQWGTLTQPEYAVAQSPWSRLSVRWHATATAGWAGYRRAGEFFQLLTELAFKKHQARFMGNESGNVAEIQRLRARIAALRAQSA